MTTYQLQQLECGRVVLHDKNIRHSTVIRTIEAASWLDAREQIHWAEFQKRDGYGYYVELNDRVCLTTE